MSGAVAKSDAHTGSGNTPAELIGQPCQCPERVTDAVNYGIHICRDGKRIAPEDFYIDRPDSDAGAGIVDWQPIETAPKDGKPLLLFVDGGCETGWWREGHWTNDISSEVGCSMSPTHWMPLPPPPVTEGDRP